MNIIKLFLIIGVIVWVSALGYGLYRVYLSFDFPELRLTRIGLKAAELEKETEKEKQETLKQQAETAKVLAKLRRQERLENSQAVSMAAVTLATFLRLSPVLAFLTAISGGLVYVLTKKVPVKTPYIETLLPVRKAAAIVEKSLQVSNAAEMARSLAFQEEVSRARIHDTAGMISAFKGITGRENGNQTALTAGNDAPTVQAGNIPTFAEILNGLDEGDSMIFGYNAETGEPITGDFSRLYSSFIGGRSGSGKTSALRGLILQSLKTTPDIEYLIHDPHSEHKEPLAQTLPKCRQIHFAGNEPAKDIRRFAEALQERLDMNAVDAPPLVLVVDELAYCSKQKYFRTFQAMFDRISTEGRKVRVYLLASSQDLRFRKTGDFRDTLASSFLFNLKSGQVKAFTQDSDLTKLHKQVRVANAPGVALLDLTDGDPVIIKTPFCSPNDARFLPLNNSRQAVRQEIDAETIEETNPNVIPFPKLKRRETPIERAETGETEIMQETVETLSDDEIRDALTVKLETPGASLSGIAAEIGVNKGVLHRFVKNGETPSDTTRACCMAFLRHETAIRESKVNN